jgi:hypothetical protein
VLEVGGERESGSGGAGGDSTDLEVRDTEELKVEVVESICFGEYIRVGEVGEGRDLPILVAFLWEA